MERGYNQILQPGWADYGVNLELGKSALAGEGLGWG